LSIIGKNVFGTGTVTVLTPSENKNEMLSKALPPRRGDLRVGLCPCPFSGDFFLRNKPSALGGMGSS
jgi:hypothetical protein